ncbi:cytokinin riboside 5'-monophosphate phosphoribohydrolase LOG3-like protein [Tanacetum coccineum]
MQKINSAATAAGFKFQLVIFYLPSIKDQVTVAYSVGLPVLGLPFVAQIRLCYGVDLPKKRLSYGSGSFVEIHLATHVDTFKILAVKMLTAEIVGEVKATADTYQRKAEMAKHSDAFIALPGFSLLYIRTTPCSVLYSV